MKTLKDLFIKKRELTRVTENEEYVHLINDIQRSHKDLKEQIEAIKNCKDRRFYILGSLMLILERFNEKNYKEKFEIDGAHMDSLLKAFMEAADLLQEETDNGAINYIESNLASFTEVILQELIDQEKK